MRSCSWVRAEGVLHLKHSDVEAGYQIQQLAGAIVSCNGTPRLYFRPKRFALPATFLPLSIAGNGWVHHDITSVQLATVIQCKLGQVFYSPNV
jgi:hypothetical protein